MQDDGVMSHDTLIRKFNVGDRVERLIDVFDQSSRLMRGSVVECYSDYRSRFGPYPELYAVTWDHDGYRKGYLPHGLDAAKESKCLTP